MSPRIFSVLGLTALFAACGGDDSSKSTDDPSDDVAQDTADTADSGDATGPDPYDVEVGPFSSTVRWTEYGVPHIVADNYGSIGYGMGFAFAQDHVCTLMDQIVMVRSERARWFGPGADDLYLNQDFGWLGLRVVSDAESGWFELDADIQQGLIGYAAGVNTYVAEVGIDSLPDERCAGAEWVREINHIDLLAYYLAFGLQGSGSVFVDAVGSAAPPSMATSTDAPRYAPPPIERTLQLIAEPPWGSNGWALGSDKTASGAGMLLSNTHFPVVGERKWHESHLTIPGQLDVYGASLMGVPLINIGFNRSVAWTHTVSSAPRFVAVMLQLEPGNPTRYDHYGTMKDMDSDVVSVEVLRGGELETVERTLWFSEYGPVINAPVVGWSSTLAFAIQDANADNLGMIPTWFDMNRADSMAEFQAAHETHAGIPWVHTMAADTEGTAWYIDSSAVPNWSEEAERAFPELLATDPIANLFYGYGVYAVPSSDRTFAWVEEPGAREPGLVPYDKMPQVTRTDYVYNANDNHWLSNASAPLTGYPYLYGSEETARSPRTRMNLRYLTASGAEWAVGEDGRFDLEELEAAALSGRSIFAEELHDALLGRCSVHADDRIPVEGADEPVHLAPVCAALASWDGRVGVESVGGAIMREFLGSDVFTWNDLKDGGALWAEPFDADLPATTPRGLAPVIGVATEDPILRALALATVHIEAAGFSVDTALGDMQFIVRGDDLHPIPGGPDLEGTIQIATYSGGASATLLDVPGRGRVVHETTDLTEDGYIVNYGNSWVMTVDMGGESPSARAIMTYSQAEYPASEHYADQTELYGTEQRLRAVRFDEADIQADPTLVERVLTYEAGG